MATETATTAILTTDATELKAHSFVIKPATLESLLSSKVVQIRKKINEGTKLSREEKNWLTATVNNNTYSKYSIPLGGWLFSFLDILKKYLVNDKYNTATWTEYYAVDITSLREAIYDNTCKIKEVKEKTIPLEVTDIRYDAIFFNINDRKDIITFDIGYFPIGSYDIDILISEAKALFKNEYPDTFNEYKILEINKAETI